MKKILVAALALASVSAPAMAADFSGPYVGVAATVDNIQGSGSMEGLGFTGAGASVMLGYDLSFNSLFAGVEANADLSTADVAGLNAKWAWGIGARAGVKVSENTGVYARAGYQRNQFTMGGDKEWADGVRLGLGVETGLTENLSLRAEFNRVDMEADIVNHQGLLGLVYGF